MKLLRLLNLTKKKETVLWFCCPHSLTAHALSFPLQTSYKKDLGPWVSYSLEGPLKIWSCLDKDLFPLFKESPTLCILVRSGAGLPQQKLKKPAFLAPLQVRHQQMAQIQPIRQICPGL